MFKKRFSNRTIVIGLILAAVLVSVLTIVVFGQIEPEDPEAVYLPDKITPVEEEELELGDRDTSKFMFIPDTAFVDNKMDYVIAAGGCIYRTGGSFTTEYSLQLPEGAEIDYIRIYFYDNSETQNARVFLYAYDGMGGDEVIKIVQSDGTPGQSSAGSGLFSHVVNNASEALALQFFVSSIDGSLKICGVKVRYQYSGVFGTFLPFVTK